MEIREVLAVNLRKLRQAKGLSQEELAHRAEIDRTYVSALERFVYAAGIDVVDRIANVLGVERPIFSSVHARPLGSGMTDSGGGRVFPSSTAITRASDNLP